MTGKPRDQHLPEGSPDLPAGGNAGGHDPNTRRVAGHEGETAAQATGSDRLLWCIDVGLALCAAALVWPRATAAARPVAGAAAGG